MMMMIISHRNLCHILLARTYPSRTSLEEASLTRRFRSCRLRSTTVTADWPASSACSSTPPAFPRTATCWGSRLDMAAFHTAHIGSLLPSERSCHAQGAGSRHMEHCTVRLCTQPIFSMFLTAPAEPELSQVPLAGSQQHEHHKLQQKGQPDQL